MGKRLTPIDQFYIDNHKDVHPDKLAKLIGCTPRTIYNYLAKGKAEARTEEGRNALKEVGPVNPPTKEEVMVQEQPKPPLPMPGMHLIGRKGGAVALTKEASEVGDEIAKLGSRQIHPEYMHVIKKEE